MIALGNKRLLFAAVVALLAALPLSAADRVRHFTVILSEPSIAQRVPSRLRAPDGRARTDKPEFQLMTRRAASAQDPLKRAIEDLGVEVTSSVCHVLNAVFVKATRKQARQLGRLAGIKRVVQARRFKLMLNAAEDIVGLPAAWNALGGVGNAGAGIRIGIIDTGIDIDHPALDDSSLAPPPEFPKGRPEHLAFTSNKVIAARSYVQLLSSQDPTFSRADDETPRDRVGHGTAVAAIAAGQRVSAPAAVLTGVAPKAFLGNYKIFGSPDINEFSNSNAVIAAIDDAVIDDMDIISISFGAVAQFPYDSEGDTCFEEPGILCDPVALAAQSAVEDFGVVVIAAAGNAGAFGEQQFPTLNSIATPASVPAVTAVGATVNSRQFVRSVRFAGQSVTAISGTGPKPASPLAAEGRDAAAVGDPFGCQTLPEDSLQGAIAIVARGECDFEYKVANVAAVGAVGVVVTNVDGQDEPFVMVELETIDIPAFMIGASAGQVLRQALGNSPGTVVTLNPTLVARPFAPDQVAPFSSRGPSPSNNLKPDLVAPGVFIYTAAQQFDPNGDTFDATGYLSVDGTSFAAPFVAGAAALVKQRNPGFSAAQVKSALVNSTSDLVFEDDEFARVTSMGAGLLQIPAALDPIATAEPATISFGALNGVALPLKQDLILANVGSGSETFHLSIEPYDFDPNAAVSVNGAATVDLELGAGSSTTVEVGLSGTTPPLGAYEGVIRVESASGGASLRIPYYYVVGDGVPFNSFAIAGTGVVGTVNEPHPELLIFRVVDRYGQPIADLDVQFHVVAGGGSIFATDSATDAFGVAAADVDMGPDTGPQDFEAVAGGFTIPFFNAARRKPFIGAIVNGASFAAGQPVAPGSIVSIFGEFLAEFLGSAYTLPLPVALKHVSVSFDFPEEGISVPGRFYFSSAGQLNIQVPWELAGLNFVFVKARIEDSASTVFNLPLADYAPGIFEFRLGGKYYGAVTHADGTVVTAQSPARAGETVVVYATGLGPVDSPQTTGVPAPFSPLVRTQVVPEVTVGGKKASVRFSGLTPDLVGLYQVNVTLPDLLPSGDQQLFVSVAGIQSNSVTVPIL